jgi:hypothetical protein
MPSGSGPLALPISAVAVGQTETNIGGFQVSNWNSNLGNLIQFTGAFTPPSTGGSLVLKIRQGGSITDTQVGPTITLPVTGSTVTLAAVAGFDNSAFGQAQQGSTYIITAMYAAATGGTITGMAVFQTCAPIG